MANDTQPGYWNNYTNLQRVKHALIREYLAGWFPKLGFWSGRVVYVDTHAGRGKHAGGEHGSPLVALRTLLGHRAKADLLDRCEFFFQFLEHDAANVDALEAELSTLLPLPDGLNVDVHLADSFEHLGSLVKGWKAAAVTMAPAFVFVDPYGFKVPGALLRDLMSVRGVELFINVIWRELDMAIQAEVARDVPTGMSRTLDGIFDGESWREQLVVGDFDERADRAAQTFREIVGAKWATHFRMRGRNGQTRYLLLHLTNHAEGRKLIKDCMWKVCPDGSFEAYRSDNLNQTVIVMSDPDLTDLREWVRKRLHVSGRRWQDLDIDLVDTLWRSPHLTKAIRAMREAKQLGGKDYTPPWSRKANPLLFLTEQEPSS